MSENTQGNSYYDSDSFVSDTEERINLRKKIFSQPINKNRRDRDVKQIYISASKSQRNNSKKVLSKPLHPVRLEVTAQRILSARNHKITDQSNAISHLIKQIEELKNENKTLKNQSIRQEKALNKIETKQTDLPKILDQHEAEVFNLKELLRRSKDALNSEIKHHKESDHEIRKLRDNLHRANQLIEDNNLDERSILQSQINDLQEKLYSKEKQLETSTRHIEHLEKIHKQEINTIKKQTKKYYARCQELGHELALIKQNLKEKERLLEIQNIYSQRFKTLHKTLSNFKQVDGVDSSEHQSDQLLDKLNFSCNSYQKDKDDKVNLNSVRSDIINANMIDEERIKQDIRKILEEEILSGRIKPFEVIRKSPEEYNDTSSQRSLGKESDNGRSTVQDSYNTEKAAESEIFDRDPITQIQNLVEEPIETEIDQESLDQERRNRQLLLDKLNKIEESEDSSKLLYSYPHDKDYLGNDQSVSDIETIPVINAQQNVKSYQFSNATDNLHNGLPANKSKGDGKPLISKKAQIDASHNQRNNSNTLQEDVLPPLSSSEKKRRESELLCQLFGDDFTPQPIVHGRPYPTGTRQSRSGNLWVNENESEKKRNQENFPESDNNRSIDLNYSQDIEEIVL